MHTRWRAWLLVACAACGAQRTQTEQRTQAEQRTHAAPAIASLPAMCSADLSRWFRVTHSPFVPGDVATAAERPAVLALQARACACAHVAHALPPELLVHLRAAPERGVTSVSVDLTEPLGRCIGVFAVAYRPVRFRGDQLPCAGCEAPAAELADTIELDLAP